MMLERISDGTVWNGERIGEVAHPMSIEKLWSVDELAAIGLRVRVRPPKPERELSSEDVDAERGRRIAGGVTFGGKVYNTTEISYDSFRDAMALTRNAIDLGAQPGDYRWHGLQTDFAWSTSDGEKIVMDAPTCLALASHAISFRASILLAAQALKALPSIPEDFRDDRHWPS